MTEQPCLKKVLFDDGNTILYADVTPNGHLECILNTATSSTQVDNDNMRRLVRWLKRERGYIVAMNRNKNDYPGHVDEYFTMAYHDLGYQLDDLREGVAELLEWWMPNVMLTFEYQGRSYVFSSPYNYSYGITAREYAWNFCEIDNTGRHARVLEQLPAVQQTKLIRIDNSPFPPLFSLDIVLKPKQDLLGGLQEVVRGLAGV
jgi:hypothetical protein